MRKKTSLVVYLRTALKALGVVILSTFFCLSAFAEDEIPTFKMNGEVSLLSNYVERGLTQTNKDPSLQGNFSFNFGPQFKMGLFGSNVNYQSTEHFLLKVFAELKIVVSSTTDFKLGYHQDTYFRTTTRNGSTTFLEVNSHGYRVLYESLTDWEGTGNGATYYAFGKVFDLSADWKWDNQIGYSMLSSTGFENYFDLRSIFLYKGGNNITYQMGATATSNASQFNGQGDIMAIVGASTSF